MNLSSIARAKHAAAAMPYVLMLLAVAAISTARAADAVFPQGSRVGLIPPQGLVASKTFAGFEDPDKKAAIVLFELPREAYADLENSNSLQAAQQQGLSIEKREEFKLPDARGVLFTGTAEAAGARVRKWLLFAGMPDVTAAVNVQVPEDAKDAYPDEAIRAALTTLVVRPIPVQERLSLLPFKVGDLSGFRIVDVVQNRTVILTDGPSDDPETIEQPQIVVGAAASPPVPASERLNFSRDVMSSLSAFKEMHITFAEPVRISGQQGFEMRVDAKHVKSGADVVIVQWIRFGAGAVLRIVGVAPKDKWAAAFPRFRAVRDGIDTR